MDAWPRNPTKNFKFRNCLIRATSIVKDCDEEKYVHSGYRMIFDSAGSCSFHSETARNVIIFGVHNSSSSHAENCKNNVLVLGTGPIFGINGRFGSPEKNFSIDFSKANTTHYLSLHYSVENSYLSRITQFCFGSVSTGFSAADFRELFLNGSMYDFHSITILLINLAYQTFNSIY